MKLLNSSTDVSSRQYLKPSLIKVTNLENIGLPAQMLASHNISWQVCQAPAASSHIGACICQGVKEKTHCPPPVSSVVTQPPHDWCLGWLACDSSPVRSKIWIKKCTKAGNNTRHCHIVGMRYNFSSLSISSLAMYLLSYYNRHHTNDTNIHHS